VERLDDASTSFFVFFSQDNIFMAWVLEDLAVVSGSDASTRQLIKPWAATARAGPSAFAINADTAGGIASVGGQRLSFYAGIDANCVLSLRGHYMRQQRLIVSRWLPCGPMHTREATRVIHPRSDRRKPSLNLG
jgi:hypothetical protein